MHLSHFFKKVGRGAASVFGLARQQKAPADTAPTADATVQPTLHDATTNAGEGVVNFSSMKQPPVQKPKDVPTATPGGTPMGTLNG